MDDLACLTCAHLQLEFPFHDARRKLKVQAPQAAFSCLLLIVLGICHTEVNAQTLKSNARAVDRPFQPSSSAGPSGTEHTLSAPRIRGHQAAARYEFTKSLC